MSGNFTFQADEARMFGLDVSFLLNKIYGSNTVREIWICVREMLGNSQGILVSPKCMNPVDKFNLYRSLIFSRQFAWNVKFCFLGKNKKNYFSMLSAENFS